MFYDGRRITKLERVLSFVSSHPLFVWSDFIKYFKCQYPCTETNYLSMLVRAGYVRRYARGKYQVNAYFSTRISYSDLKKEAYG